MDHLNLSENEKWELRRKIESMTEDEKRLFPYYVLGYCPTAIKTYLEVENDNL